MRNRKAILSWTIPVVSVAMAAAIRHTLEPWLGPTIPYGLFFLAVVITALSEGFFPALFAGLLSAVVVDLVFLESRYGAQVPETVCPERRKDNMGAYHVRAYPRFGRTAMAFCGCDGRYQ